MFVVPYSHAQERLPHVCMICLPIIYSAPITFEGEGVLIFMSFECQVKALHVG